jgi:hypothetical protein
MIGGDIEPAIDSKNKNLSIDLEGSIDVVSLETLIKNYFTKEEVHGIYLSIYVSIHPSIYLSTCLYIYQFISVSVSNTPIYLSIYHLTINL